MNLDQIKYKISKSGSYLGSNLMNIAIIIILMIGLYFFAKSVTKTVSEVKIAKSDTTRSITHITQPTVYTQTYSPYRVTDTVIKQSIIIPQEYKPSEDIIELRKQVAELSYRLFKTNKYKDTIKLRDTTGLVVGNVNIADSITQNMIAGRRVDYTLKFPRETVIVDNYIAPKPTTQLYLGPDVTFSARSVPPVNQAGFSAILKTKKDFLFKAGGGLQFEPNSTKPYISFGFYPKIKF
jgi:hypothetical protein